MEEREPWNTSKENHSKENHDGKLKVSDWRVTLTSSHHGALSRQVTEAVRISNEGLDTLLNSKYEFGANNLSEVGVRKGNYMVGDSVKNGGAKRKRGNQKLEQGEEEPVDVDQVDLGQHDDIEDTSNNKVKQGQLKDRKVIKAIKTTATMGTVKKDQSDMYLKPANMVEIA